VKRDPIIIVVVAMVISLLLVFGVTKARHRNDPPDAGRMLKNQMAPDFALTSLDGKTTIRLSDYRGKAVLLNFWATWCVPCKIEMPWFVELQNQYGAQGLQVVGVAMDDASPEDIAKFAKDMGVNYPIAVGKEAVGDAYGGVQFLPATFYIGRDGKVIDKVFGLKGKHEIQDDIKKALDLSSAIVTPATQLSAAASGKAIN
jgi:peroxiredoxin